MPNRTSTGNRTTVSATLMLETLGASLLKIKTEDNLTWADVGAALGKSQDRAAQYAAGCGDMGFVSYMRGKAAWNGRFTRDVESLVEKSAHSDASDRARHTSILKAALALAVALEDDDEIDVNEVRANRATIENARHALDGLLAKLKPVAA